MTYTLYPHPPYYFVTLSKPTESRFFFNHPPTLSHNVTLYHVFFLMVSLTVLLPGHSPDVWLPNIHVKVKRTKLSLGISKQILVWPGPSFYVIIKVSQVNILGAKYWVLSISRALLVYLAFRINELTCKGSKFSPGIPMNDSTIKGDKNKM